MTRAASTGGGMVVHGEPSVGKSVPCLQVVDQLRETRAAIVAVEEAFGMLPGVDLAKARVEPLPDSALGELVGRFPALRQLRGGRPGWLLRGVGPVDLLLRAEAVMPLRDGALCEADVSDMCRRGWVRSHGQNPIRPRMPGSAPCWTSRALNSGFRTGGAPPLPCCRRQETASEITGSVTGSECRGLPGTTDRSGLCRVAGRPWVRPSCERLSGLPDLGTSPPESMRIEMDLLGLGPQVYEGHAQVYAWYRAGPPRRGSRTWWSSGLPGPSASGAPSTL
jgi:hypothetical protein